VTHHFSYSLQREPFRQWQTARKVVHEHDNSRHTHTPPAADDQFRSEIYINKQQLEWLRTS